MTNRSSNWPDYLMDDLRAVLRTQGWHDLVDKLPATTQDDPLRIAFVGPYNAGKSSIIAALTGDLSIPRSGKPESSDARRYAWHDGVEFVDLPGWFSGFTEHDDRADENLRRNADMVAFVLTVELGNELVVESIEHVLGFLGFANRAVIIMNKSLSEDSDPLVIREEIARRLGRHATVPVYTTDAQSFLDTISGEFDLDEESRQTLTESSGIEELSQALTNLVARHGLSARAKAQSLQGARVANEALDRLFPDEVERATINELDELESALGEAQDRLTRLAESHLSRMRSDMSLIADRVLTETSLSASEHDLAWFEACTPALALADDATKVVTELSKVLGGVVSALNLDVEASVTLKSESYATPRAQQALGIRVLDAMGIDATWAAKKVANAGKRVADDGSGKGSLAYELARKLQPKKAFKPYERIKDSVKIERGANWLGKVSVVVPALEEIWGWRKEIIEARAVERSNEEVRQRYAAAADAEVERIRTEFEEWRHGALTPYHETLQAGRKPLHAVAADRERTSIDIAALRNGLLAGPASHPDDHG